MNRETAVETTDFLARLSRSSGGSESEFAIEVLPRLRRNQKKSESEFATEVTERGHRGSERPARGQRFLGEWSFSEWGKASTYVSGSSPITQQIPGSFRLLNSAVSDGRWRVQDIAVLRNGELEKGL